MNFVDKLGNFVKKYLSLLVLIGAAISYINSNGDYVNRCIYSS